MNVSTANNVPEADEDFQTEIKSNVTCFHGPSSRASQATVCGSSPTSPRHRNSDEVDCDEEPIDPRVQVRTRKFLGMSALILHCIEFRLNWKP